MVLMRTAPQFSHKYPGKLVVALRTAVRFSQKYFFKKHPSAVLLEITRQSCGSPKNRSEVLPKIFF